MENVSNRKKELLLQYEQVRQDWRLYHKSVWQTPSLAFGVESALLTIVLHPGFDLNPVARIGILFTGSLLVLGLTITFIKHSYFQKLKAKKATEIAEKLSMEEEHFPRLEWSKKLTAEAKDLEPKGFVGKIVRKSAVKWLINLLFLVLFINILLCVLIAFIPEKLIGI